MDTYVSLWRYAEIIATFIAAFTFFTGGREGVFLYMVCGLP